MKTTPTLQAAYDRTAAYADDIQDHILEIQDYVLDRVLAGKTVANAEALADYIFDLEDFMFVMAAWVDGAVIQRNVNGKWFADDFPVWEEAELDEFRIAPYH